MKRPAVIVISVALVAAGALLFVLRHGNEQGGRAAAERRSDDGTRSSSSSLLRSGSDADDPKTGRPNGGIEGVVVDPEGAPVANADVALIVDDWSSLLDL